MTIEDPVSADLQSWAEREIRPWRERGLRRIATEQALHAHADQKKDLRLFRFADGVVTVQPVKAGKPRNPDFDDRAEIFSRLFRAVLPLLPPGLTTTLCVGMGDRVLPPFDLPVFGFQRAQHEPTPLLPDIDMIIHDFHGGEHFRDTVPYAAKATRAVFSGSTTGYYFTLQDAQEFRLPRLRAAKFFESMQDVEFGLPSIVQCSEETRQFLEQQSFCQVARTTWHDQFRNKFLLSMDGNGATCSRVAVALASHGVLVKYDSEHILYYFPALRPGTHFLPVSTDHDVQAIIDAEKAAPGRYAHVAASANAFVATYLTRARALEYTARLIVTYAASLKEGRGVFSTAPVRRVVSSARNMNGTVLEADDAGWAGRPGSGERLSAFAIATRPPGASFRLLYFAALDNGRFLPASREGKWCASDDEGAGLAALTIDFPRDAPPLPFVLEARFTDGTKASTTRPGVACRAPSGAPLEAFRVRLT